MKKIVFLALIVVLCAMMSGVALAADTPHGPFADNTELCAACHRAHTAQAEYLIADTNTLGICEACHDGSGADCDVVTGTYVDNGSWVSSAAGDREAATTLDVLAAAGQADLDVASATGYDAGEQVAIGPANGTPADFDIYTIDSVAADIITLTVNLAEAHAAGQIVGNYTESANDHETWGVAGDQLMGGGFDEVTGTATTSAHIDNTTTAATKWDVQFGENAAPGAAITELDCVDCHVPHRSGNYRMLRRTPLGANDEVAAIYVGDNFNRNVQGGITESHRYTEGMVLNGDGDTLDTVDNVDETAVGLDLNGDGDALDVDVDAVSEGVGMFNVKRAYDAASPDEYKAGTNNDGVSEWCGQCHDVYYSSAQSAGDDDDADPSAGNGITTAPYYDVDDDAAAENTYMHAIDVNLQYVPRNESTSGSTLDLFANLRTSSNANRLPVANANGAASYDATDELTCLTCHRAHGSEAAMTGSARTGVFNRLVDDPAHVTDDLGDSMLLRLPNRGVCETCHDMPVGY